MTWAQTDGARRGARAILAALRDYCLVAIPVEPALELILSLGAQAARASAATGRGGCADDHGGRLHTYHRKPDARFWLRLGHAGKCVGVVRCVGCVSLVSTDHVSWSEDRKVNPDMLANASGVPGLEAMVPLLVKGLVERNLPLTHAAKLLSFNPARHFRIDDRKGALAPGRDADITVLVDKPVVYDGAASGNNVVGWSPYNGITLPWTVAATYLRGQLAFDGSKVLAEPGTGQFVRPPQLLPERQPLL